MLVNYEKDIVGIWNSSRGYKNGTISKRIKKK